MPEAAADTDDSRVHPIEPRRRPLTPRDGRMDNDPSPEVARGKSHRQRQD
jgi:hypothetical protein